MTMQEMASYYYCYGTMFKVFGDENKHTLATIDFSTGECMDAENERFYGLSEIERFIFPESLAVQNNGFNWTSPKGVTG
jgi:hypothetical protein